jgi:urea transport system substrate-binding protein
MRLGRITGGGQLETIWSSETAIRPEPFPASRSRAEWQQLLADCYERWGRHWTKPRAYLRTS